MYPLNFFSLFPPFPRENKVFVAMDFDSRFDKHWTYVIAPGVCSVKVNGAALEPYRVDVRRVSDSILTEILTGISNCCLFFADITTIGRLDGRPIRNGNVMYEVGIAHAVRLAEEVILFRSDNDHLLFDLANIRVNEYEPDHRADEARQRVSDALMIALKEVDLQRHLAVQRAVASLDLTSWRVLLESQSRHGVISHPVVRTMGEALSETATIAAISRLLELEILSTRYAQITPESLPKMKDLPIEELLKYEVTPFGEAVIAEVKKKQFPFGKTLIGEIRKYLPPDHSEA